MPAKAARPAASSSGKRRSPRAPAEAFKSTREAHARETAEDYAEAIADLIATTGEARVTDLARQLGVTHVTVNRTIARLQQAGYVTAQPYRAIFLTSTGEKLARESKRRHEIVVRFLRAIGVPEAAAQRDAEGIEHHVSADTLAAFERTLRRAGQV